MRELAAASWDLYREAIQLGTRAMVRPSIPILFFGDDERYAASALKVVTVGLNHFVQLFFGTIKLLIFLP